MTLTECDVTELLAIRAGGDLDVIRKGVELVLQSLIDVEAAEAVGAERYQRTEFRRTWRNGARERLLTTKAGGVELRIPKLRRGRCATASGLLEAQATCQLTGRAGALRSTRPEISSPPRHGGVILLAALSKLRHSFATVWPRPSRCGARHHRAAQSFLGARKAPLEVHRSRDSRGRTYRWLRRCEVKDAGGNPVTVSSHQFRHTMATRMLNLGVPQHIVQQMLGHVGADTVATYARLSDTTMRREFERYQHERVNIQGQLVVFSDTSPTAEAEWVKHRISKALQTLPNGECGRPIQQACSHPNACLTCDEFLTDKRHLDAHGDQLARTRNSSPRPTPTATSAWLR